MGKIATLIVASLISAGCGTSTTMTADWKLPLVDPGDWHERKMAIIEQAHRHHIEEIELVSRPCNCPEPPGAVMSPEVVEDEPVRPKGIRGLESRESFEEGDGGELGPK